MRVRVRPYRRVGAYCGDIAHIDGIPHRSRRRRDKLVRRLVRRASIRRRVQHKRPLHRQRRRRPQPAVRRVREREVAHARQVRQREGAAVVAYELQRPHGREARVRDRVVGNNGVRRRDARQSPRGQLAARHVADLDIGERGQVRQAQPAELQGIGDGEAWRERVRHGVHEGRGGGAQRGQLDLRQRGRGGDGEAGERGEGGEEEELELRAGLDADVEPAREVVEAQPGRGGADRQLVEAAVLLAGREGGIVDVCLARYGYCLWALEGRYCVGEVMC